MRNAPAAGAGSEASRSMHKGLREELLLLLSENEREEVFH